MNLQPLLPVILLTQLYHEDISFYILFMNMFRTCCLLEKPIITWAVLVILSSSYSCQAVHKNMVFNLITNQPVKKSQLITFYKVYIIYTYLYICLYVLYIIYLTLYLIYLIINALNAEIDKCVWLNFTYCY